jgi:hypothetical protein
MLSLWLRLGFIGDNLRGDLRGDVRSLRASQDDLGRKPGAEAILPWKWNLSNGLENGALAGGLVTTDDELGKRHNTIEAILAQLVDNIKNAALLGTLQRLKRRGREGIFLS